MVTASLISRLSHAIDLIEKRTKTVVESRNGSPWLSRGREAARERHFAAHPEDRGANIVIFEFYDAADES